MRGSDREWVYRFMNDPAPLAQIKNGTEDAQSVIRLFNNTLILNYQNDNLWHCPLPLLREYLLRHAPSNV
jgi:hypothetical protein